MDKKIDLDKQNDSAPIKVNLNPNSNNTVTLNLNINRKRPNLTGGNNQTFIQKQRHVNYHSYASEPKNYDESNNEEIENEEIEEPENEDDSNVEDSDEETDFDKDDIDRLKEEYEKRKQEKAKKELKDKNAGKGGENSPSQTGNNPSTNPGGTSAPQGAGSAPTSGGGAAAGGSAAGGSAAGGAAAGGSVAGGWIVLIIILVILLIILLILILVTVIVPSTVSYTTEAINKYGQTCPMVTIVDSDYNESIGDYTRKYDGKVDFETYIAGVVAATNGSANDIEYYKAIAISARTYAQKNMDSNCMVKGNDSFQKYIDVNIIEKNNAEKIKEAITLTETKVLVKNGDLLELSKDNWGINQIDALSLIKNKNYSYENILIYYYGNEPQIESNTMLLTGIRDGYVNPTRSIACTSAFGERINPITEKKEQHTGLDIGFTASGEPIYAAKAGIIVEVKKDVTQIGDCDYGYGNYVKIIHEDNMTTLYAHMKYGSIPDKIVNGYKVKRGEQIGQIGSTGCSTGPHLHYEVRGPLGGLKDPADYLDLLNASGTCKR